jgi:type VI secretion system secreted protein VgrG
MHPSFCHPSVRVLLLAAGLVLSVHSGAAQTIVLGAADTFAVLGGTTVTNTGATFITGDVGVSPGGAITGFPPGVVTGGTLHAGDATASLAHDAAATAYAQLAGLAFTQDLSGLDLGNRTLGSGVYRFSAAAAMNGVLTLDGAGTYVFQIGSTLTTGVSSFNLINGASAADVWFQVGSSATLGTGTSFSGTIIAAASDTLATGVSVNGRILALGGAVTLDANSVTNTAAVPEPAATALLVSGLALLATIGVRARRRPAV